MEAEQAERAGDFGKVAEIRYGKTKTVEDELHILMTELQAKQANSSLVKEEVTSEDIA